MQEQKQTTAFKLKKFLFSTLKIVCKEVFLLVKMVNVFVDLSYTYHLY